MDETVENLLWYKEQYEVQFNEMLQLEKRKSELEKKNKELEKENEKMRDVMHDFRVKYEEFIQAPESQH